MIDIKTPEEIEKMKIGGNILATVLHQVLSHAKVGVSELELDSFAERLILEKRAEPGFKKVKGYAHTICTATNDVVVHGVPTSYRLKAGDIICIDAGVYYQGYHTDMAETIEVKNEKLKVKNYEIDAFLKTGKKALEEAIKVAKAGNHIGHISQTIQKIVEKEGFSVVRSLIGHGVGKQLHEEPEVPGFLVGLIEKTPLLKPGMTIAIEVIYNMGRPDVVYANKDGWTIKTKDGSLSAVFERSVAITKDGPIVLTG